VAPDSVPGSVPTSLLGGATATTRPVQRSPAGLAVRKPEPAAGDDPSWRGSEHAVTFPSPGSKPAGSGQPGRSDSRIRRSEVLALTGASRATGADRLDPECHQRA